MPERAKTGDLDARFGPLPPIPTRTLSSVATIYLIDPRQESQIGKTRQLPVFELYSRTDEFSNLLYAESGLLNSSLYIPGHEFIFQGRGYSSGCVLQSKITPAPSQSPDEALLIDRALFPSPLEHYHRAGAFGFR